MEEFRTTLIYFPSMTPSRSRWQQCAAKRQVMQHKPKRYSIAAALFCPGLSLCVEWSRPNKQLHELQCCGSRLCMFSTLPFLTIVAIFLFCSTHVFFFIRWDYGVMETSAKYLLDVQVEHTRLSMLWYLWSGKQPVSKSRVNQMEDYRMKIWKSLQNLETPRVHRWWMILVQLCMA